MLHSTYRQSEAGRGWHRWLFVGLVAAGTVAGALSAAPARADYYRHWHGHWFHGRFYRDPVYVGPPGVYAYAPPPVVYAPPPPAYYAPPPAVYAPGLGLNVVVPLRIR